MNEKKEPTHNDAVIAVRIALIQSARNIGNSSDVLAVAALNNSYTGMTDYMEVVTGSPAASVDRV